MAKQEAKQDSLYYYNQLRQCPTEALKTIGAGRLKGMSDINPQWRIQKMTETFGLCGIGWKYEIVKQWNEAYGNEVKTYCNINLYVKVDGVWSEAIPGTGGSSFVAQERSGAFVSDENLKMALTDALSVAMKALGVAADVYYSKGAIQFGTKYEQQAYMAQQTQESAAAKTAAQPTKQAQVTIETVKGWIAQAKTESDLLKCFNACPKELQEQAKPLLTEKKNQIKAQQS